MVSLVSSLCGYLFHPAWLQVGSELSRHRDWVLDADRLVRCPGIKLSYRNTVASSSGVLRDLDHIGTQKACS